MPALTRRDTLAIVYREWPSSIAGSTAWTAESDGTTGRVLPDGCMDLLWIGGHLVVAGPDRSSFLTSHPEGARYAGLRFAPGLGPSVFGVPRTPCAMSGSGSTSVGARRGAPSRGTGRRGDQRVRGLEAVVARHARDRPVVDPLLADIVRRARRGDWVASIASAIGLSTRQLQRRAVEAFGYGPKLLARILRLGDALDLARRGVPLADLATDLGGILRDCRENSRPVGGRRGGFSDVAAEDFGDPADSRPGVLARAQGAVNFRVSTSDGHGEMR